jgi:hypothetical protein
VGVGSYQERWHEKRRRRGGRRVCRTKTKQGLLATGCAWRVGMWVVMIRFAFEM